MNVSLLSFSTIIKQVFILSIFLILPLVSNAQTDIESIVRDVGKDLQFKYRTEKLMDGNTKIYLEKYSDLPTGERRFIVIIPKASCNDQPNYCSMNEQSGIYKPAWSDRDLGESYRSQLESENDLPIGAHLRWKGDYGKYIVNAFIDFDSYEKVSLGQARSSMDPMFLKVNNRMISLGSDKAKEPKEDVQMTINECQNFGVTDEKNDMVISMKDLKENMASMIKNYETKNGKKIKSASDKYVGLSTSLFFDLGGHLFTEDHEKYKTFNTSEKDKKLAEIIKTKYKDKKATPVDILEEALLINDHCMYDALLNCHNFTKRQSYHLRNLNQATNTAKHQLDEAKKELEKTSDPKVLKRLNISVTVKQNQYDKQKKIQENHLMNTNMVKIRAREDNEGAWYHFYGVSLNGFAERENLKYPNLLFETPQAFSVSAVGLEHYGKNLVKLRAQIRDKIEYCWDWFGVRLGYSIHKSLPENKSLFRKRFNDLKNFKTSLKNGIRFPETSKHLLNATLEGVSDIKNSAVSKVKEIKNGFYKKYQDFKNKWF